MRQFGKILKFELKNYFANKVFVGITIFLMLLITGVMFAPRVIELFEKDDTVSDGGMSEGEGIFDENGNLIEGEDAVDRTGFPVMLLAGEAASQLKAGFAGAFFDYDVQVSDANVDEIKEQVMSGEAECAFVFDSMTSCTYYVNNLSMYDSNMAIASEVLQNIHQVSAMLAGGLSEEEISNILYADFVISTETLGKNQMQNYFYTYIMIMALYMVILLYGQMIATNVATEKSSRAMELLVTSAKPVSMMFGKVLASCLAGFVQLLCVFGVALVTFNLNKDYWDSMGVVASIFNIPPSLLVYMLLFFVLGFLIFAFMFGAVGSMASKLEDINTSSMPITLLFVIGFLVVMMSLAANEVDTILMKICSFVPFTSPMAMFTRIAMSTVPWYEIAISIALLVVSVIGVGILSAKIYRVGVLLYGTPPKMGAILKAIRKS